MAVTHDDLNFVWEMTEADFNNFKSPIGGSNNYCGAVYFGKCKCEFVWEPLDCNEYISFTNLYVLDRDDGYAELEDGTVYSFEDDCIPIGMIDTFEPFKQKCENDIVIALNTDKSYLAEYAVGETQAYRWNQPIKY